MCGRFSNSASFSEIQIALKVEQLEFFRDWRPTFNICPTYSAGYEQLIVTKTREGKRAIRLGRWWMIPWFWKKPLKSLPTSFNARSDEIQTKPFWRDAFRSSRCLVPATGWREFAGKRGKKQPHHFHFGHQLFAFAGLWSTWIAATGEVVDSFAIVTTEPSKEASKIHDRMPLVLPAECYDDWLGAEDPMPTLNMARAVSLTLPLEIYASDPIGNGSSYEGPEVIAPFAVKEEAPAPVQQSFAWADRAPGPSKRS
jgi:putative SOS response-associated peptidase YedK